MKDKLTTFLKSKSFYVIFSILLSVIAWLLGGQHQQSGGIPNTGGSHHAGESEYFIAK